MRRHFVPTQFDELVSLVMAARNHGDRCSFTFLPDDRGMGPVDVDQTHTFASLIERAARLASAFVEAGVVPGDRVALYRRPDDTYVTALIASILCGAVVAPVNHLFKLRELESYLHLIEPRLIVVDDTTASVAAAGRGAAAMADASTVDDWSAAEPLPPRLADPAAAAFVMHTSGT